MCNDIVQVDVDAVLDKLPQAELEHSLQEFITPMTTLFADPRLRQGTLLAVRGILAGQTPVIAGVAQSVSRLHAQPWATAKRIYRLLDNPRYTHQQWLAAW
jgi:hypothetical protein